MPRTRECLIVERHEWETGGAKQQDQGKNSQHGRGRLIAIVDAPVPRFIGQSVD